MQLSNGSKRARLMDSLILNVSDRCGGPKKAGTINSVMYSRVPKSTLCSRAPCKLALNCVSTTVRQTKLNRGIISA